MEYTPLSESFNSAPLYFPLEDLGQPLFFNNGEDPYNLMEELYSTFPPSWFEEADALLRNDKDPSDVMPLTVVGDFSMPVSELLVSPEPYDHSNVDVGHSLMPVPELVVSPEPIDYNLNQQQYCSINLEPAPYVVPEYYADPSMRYHDPSYIGYSGLPPYSTNWELDASNSQGLLHNKRMGPGMTSFDIPVNHAMQWSQALEFPPAFGPEQHFIGNTSGFPLYPAAFDGTIPELFPIATFPSPSFPITLDALPYLSPFPPFSTTPESLPHLSPTVTASSSSFPSTPNTASDVLPYPFPIERSSPLSFQDLPYPSPVATAEAHPPHHRPPKKRRRKPKKDTNTLPVQQKPRRKFPNGRSSVRSQAWIDRYFSDGICRICTKGSRKKRMDRILEHLVSTHFFHAVKNAECFELVQEADVRRHFIGTNAQFEYTREYINSIRCSFCPDGSLVFRGRGKSLTDHLTRHHADVEKGRLEKERERRPISVWLSGWGVY